MEGFTVDEDLTFFAQLCTNDRAHPIIRHNISATAPQRRALLDIRNEDGKLVDRILYTPSKTPVTVQRIFRKYGMHYLEDEDVSPLTKRAVRDIVYCRTPVMGTHLETCDSCGSSFTLANSCGKRYCNLCSGIQTAKWTRKRQREVVNAGYQHCVFTIPECLYQFCLWRPLKMYNALLQAVAETIQVFASDEKYLGATPGFVSVLHTWGQNLCLHPHVHVILTAGGISKDKTRWVQPKSNTEGFLFPVKAMSEVFRGKFMSKFLEIFADTDTTVVRKECYEHSWCVYSKPAPGKNPETVIKYLARYAYRIAINNSRLISCDDGKVVFRYHDYKTGKDGTMTLSAEEFMRRYLLHVLPGNFRKIRYCGFLSSASKGTMLPLARKLTGTPEPDPLPETPEELVEAIISNGYNTCPFCESGHLVPTGLLDKVRHAAARKSKGESNDQKTLRSPEAVPALAAAVTHDAPVSLPQGPPAQDKLIA